MADGKLGLITARRWDDQQRLIQIKVVNFVVIAVDLTFNNA